MALRIKPTPYLKGKDAENFEKMIEDGLKKPAKLIETPKLWMAKEKLDIYSRECPEPKK